MYGNVLNIVGIYKVDAADNFICDCVGK